MSRQLCLPSMYLQLVLVTIVSINCVTCAGNGDVSPTPMKNNDSASTSTSASFDNNNSDNNSDDKLRRVRRQGGNFVRFGRGPSSFVRIGKMDPEIIRNRNEESPEFIRSDRTNRMSRFIRIGRNSFDGDFEDSSSSSSSNDWPYSKIKRPSGFVRIGKSMADEDGEFSKNSLFDKRVPGFVRIGKGWNTKSKRLSSFVRIGKSLDGGDNDDFDLDGDNNGIFESKRAPGFVRIGKSLNLGQDSAEIDNKKRGSFVRIGKSGTSLFNSGMEDIVNEAKRAPGFVRIGKSPFDDEISKRAPGFVRIGKSPGFVRIGKSGVDEELLKRAQGFVRIGKAFGDDLSSGKRAAGFVRIGKALDEVTSKRAAGFVRIGKSSNDGDDHLLNDKRAPGFVRIGKPHVYNDDEDDDDFLSHRTARSTFADGFDSSIFEKDLVKKPSGFVRIGKSPNDKRQSGFVRIGKDFLRLQATTSASNTDASNGAEVDKKSSGFVRIGKQMSSGGNDNNNDDDDNNSSNNNNINGDGSLSPYSSQRMGNADGTGGSHFEKRNPIHVSRRASAFVRIGKIPSAAFVPLNNDIVKFLDAAAARKAGYRRRSRNGQSSFVRIG